MFERVGGIGSSAREQFGVLGGILGLAYGAAKGLYLEWDNGRRIVLRTAATQVYFTAVQPLPFFLLTALIFGLVVIVQADQVLPRYGLHHLVPDLVVTAVVREIAPLVVAMILIGRSGTAIATELGYMRLNEEIDALSVSGINLEYFVVLPRILGVTVATICLLVAFSTTAILGGFIVGEMLGLISITLLVRELLGALTLPTIGYALAKGLLSGVVIAAANCYHGLTVAGSFTEIPRATGRGVIHSLAISFVLNALISVYAIL